MQPEERAVSFACGADRLYGVLSLPAQAAPARGVLIVVGGPQVRTGSHRQFTLLARSLAQAGVPVLRFDYRGMGDSEGAVRVFDQVDDDLHAALGADPAAAGLAQVFLSSLADDALRLQPLLDAMDRPGLRQWAHRTGGALALLHNPSVDAVVEAFRRAVHDGSERDIRVSGRHATRLLAHINALLSAFAPAATAVVHRTQVTDS